MTFKQSTIVQKIIAVIVGVFAVSTLLTGCTSAPSANSTPISIIDPMQIVVTHQITKKVEDKYRYFFDIRNKDTKPFKGEVRIKLINQDGSSIGDEKFKNDKEIAPNLGDSVYIDRHTGTPSIHGESGIASFEYTVLTDKGVAATGTGKIPDSFGNYTNLK